jgi:exosome complex exonuclease DIS3/RRP44
VGDKATENQVLLLEHDIPHSSFSEAVMECMPKLPWEITRKVQFGEGFHFCLVGQD